MTLILTVSDQETLLAWAAANVGCPEDHWGSGAEAMGCVEKDTGKIRAVFVLNGFLGDAAVLHIATDGSRGWATRNILGGYFGYMFIFKRLNRVIGFTPEANVAALTLALKIGFRIEGRIRATPEGESEIITSMFASQCDWIMQDQQERQAENG